MKLTLFILCLAASAPLASAQRVWGTGTPTPDPAATPMASPTASPAGGSSAGSGANPEVSPTAGPVPSPTASPSGNATGTTSSPTPAENPAGTRAEQLLNQQRQTTPAPVPSTGNQGVPGVRQPSAPQPATGQ